MTAWVVSVMLPPMAIFFPMFTILEDLGYLPRVASVSYTHLRTEKEKSAMYEIGAKDIIEKILPVVDNFERGLGAVTEEQKEDSFVAGL